MIAKHRNSILITFSYLISYTFNVAFMYGLLFYNRATNQDTLAWSILNICFLFPEAITNIFVGALTSIKNKKSMMFRAEVIGGLIALLFMYTFKLGYTSFLYLCIYGIFSGAIFSFFQISLDASTVNIAGKEGADRLVSLIWLARAISNLSGIIIGRVLSFNPIYLFYANILSFVVSILLQYFMNYEENVREYTISFKNVVSEFTTQLKELIYYLRANRIVSFLFLTLLILALFYLPIIYTLIPDMCKNVCNDKVLGDKAISYLESSSWLGTAIGSVIVVITNSNTFFLKNLFNLISIQALFLLTWIFPVIFKSLGTMSIIHIFIFLSILDGILSCLQTLGALAFFQVQLPEKLRGRIMGTMRTVMKISAPLGMLLYGLILKSIHWSVLMVIATLIIFITARVLNSRKVFIDFTQNL